MRRRMAIGRTIIVFISVAAITVAGIGVAVAAIRPNPGLPSSLASSSSSQTIATTTSSTSSAASTETVGLQRSGPISNYPAAWGIYSSCPGFSTQGEIATASNLSNVTYPDSWNTTTIETLSQVYESIVESSTFANTASGHGWVVYSWSFEQGDSPDLPSYIVGNFILTNATSPNGYVTAYYEVPNGNVTVSSLTTTLTVWCNTSAPNDGTSSTTTQG